MPELPDVAVYVECLERRLVGQVLRRVRIASPFVVRSFDPPIRAAEGRTVAGVRRLGKRIVFDLGDDLFLVVHLMIAGRFRWKEAGSPIPKKLGLAGFDVDGGMLCLTEAGTKKRASIHMVRGEAAVLAMHAGGKEPLEIDLETFAAAATKERHTLKRTLTDPRIFSGIGNAYSDEILHAARLSPVRMCDALTSEEMSRLYEATRATLVLWTNRLRAEAGDDFPEKVTAFRPEMAVHGKYKQACPVCGDPVQRVVRADNETNYCATCQTGGKLLADRALSRLLGSDWPRTLEEMEDRVAETPRAVKPTAKPPSRSPRERGR